MICTTQWLRVENSTHCDGEETGSKCLPSVYPKIYNVVLDRVILWDIYKSTFHLVYYVSLLMFLLVCSEFQETTNKGNIANLQSDFFYST